MISPTSVFGARMVYILLQISRRLAAAMIVISVACIWARMTLFNDPSEGNIFLHQLKEREKQLEKRKKLSDEKDATRDQEN